MKRVLGLLLLLVVVGGSGYAAAEYARSWRVSFLGTNGMVLQQTPVTCGPAALATVFQHFGRIIPEREIAAAAGTSSSGTNLLGLKVAAEHFGFNATAYQTTIAELKAMPKPVLVVFDDHFVVVTDMSDLAVIVQDPAFGRYRYGVRSFLSRWQSKVLLISPKGDTG